MPRRNSLSRSPLGSRRSLPSWPSPGLHRRGQQYLTVVVAQDSGRLVWAAPRNSATTLRSFFDALGEARSAAITHDSDDDADWTAVGAAERIPNAVLCADAFHVVHWATTALDQARIQACRDARAVARSEPTRGRGAPRKDATPRPPAPWPGASGAPTTRSRRAPRTAPTAITPSSPEPRRPTRRSAAPNCSRKDCAPSSISRTPTLSKHWIGRWAGSGAAASPRSPSSP